MFILFFTVAEVARVRNSRNMMAWSLLLAAFSNVSALSLQYLFWSRCNATLRRRDRVLYSGIFPASLAFRHSSIMMRDSCDTQGFLGYLIDFVHLMAASVTSSLNCSHISGRPGSLAKLRAEKRLDISIVYRACKARSTHGCKSVQEL